MFLVFINGYFVAVEFALVKIRPSRLDQLVVDEYGTVIGRTTLGDVLERIVGPVEDEFDSKPLEIKPDGPGKFIVPGRTGITTVENYMEETRQDREAHFDKLIKAADCANMPVKTSIRIGVPYEELLAVIEAKKPDLLVMATKGRSNLVDAIIGSCAQKMFRRSPIPVLSIRGDEKDD
jgi:nucleotide-binding universal stress UspA family protein